MDKYLKLIEDVLENGKDHKDRTGVGTKRVFGRQVRFDLREGFPLLTTKKMYWKGIIAELCWFLRGDTNIKQLNEWDCHIWDEWADENGDLGPIYGEQWLRWPTRDGGIINQIYKLQQDLINNPDSRRHIITAWNPGDIDKMALPPCHCLVQFMVEDGYLHCQLYQRSADLFLGVPFNIASYASLTEILAHKCGYDAGEFVHTFGDLHIYHNHMDQVKEQLKRKPLPLPELVMKWDSDKVELHELEPDHFELIGYTSHPKIKGDVAV